MPENDNIDTSFGDLAQLVEHTAHIRDVNGSIPLVARVKSGYYSTGFFFNFFFWFVKLLITSLIFNHKINTVNIY